MVSAALKAMVTMESFTRCKGRGWGSCCVDVRQDESFPPTLKNASRPSLCRDFGY